MLNLCLFLNGRAARSSTASVMITLLFVRSKLVAGVSWTVTLMSPLCEYGLGEEFPLSPLLWLVIAVSITLVATWPGGIRSQSGSASHTGLFTMNTTQPRLAAGSIRIRGEMNCRSQPVDAEDATLGSASQIPRSSGDVVVSVCDILSDLMLLSPATIRGPPSGCLQNDPLVAPTSLSSRRLPAVRFASKPSTQWETVIKWFAKRAPDSGSSAHTALPLCPFIAALELLSPPTPCQRLGTMRRSAQPSTERMV
jgi:hypothetical protein